MTETTTPKCPVVQKILERQKIDKELAGEIDEDEWQTQTWLRESQEQKRESDRCS